MQPETINELIYAWKSDLSNFNPENPPSTASLLLNRIEDNPHLQEWCEEHECLGEVIDLLMDIEGVVQDDEELDLFSVEHQASFEQVEHLIAELEEEIEL